MPDTPADAKPRAYWTCFALANHAVPTPDPRCHADLLIGLCGIITTPRAATDRDRTQPVCAWCSHQIRTGTHHLTSPPVTLGGNRQPGVT